MRLAIIVVLISALGGCSTFQSRTLLPENDLGIVECVVRYHFARERYDSDIAFLSIQGRDPGARTLKKLTDLGTKVLPGSRYTPRQLPYRFEILGINLKDEELAVVDAWDYYHVFFNIRYSFELSKATGVWRVEHAYRIEI